MFIAIHSHLPTAQDDDDDDEAEHDSARNIPPITPTPPSPSTPGLLQTETQLVESTVSHRLFQDLLTTYYQPLEIWYSRVIIEKVDTSPVLRVIGRPLTSESAGSSPLNPRCLAVYANDYYARRCLLRPEDNLIPSVINWFREKCQRNIGVLARGYRR